MLLGEWWALVGGSVSQLHAYVKLELIMAIKWFVPKFKQLCQRHILMVM